MRNVTRGLGCFFIRRRLIGLEDDSEIGDGDYGLGDGAAPWRSEGRTGIDQ